MSRANVQLEQLAEVVKQQLDLDVRALGSAAPSTRAGQAQLVIQPRPLGVGHLELEPDLLVYDEGIGSVGLAWLLPAAADEAAVPAFVEGCIDDAVALRNVFVEKARASPNGAHGAPKSLAALPLAVEAVLMVSPQMLAKVGLELQRIVAQSGYLYSVGVNVLPVVEPLDGPEMAQRIRRAFRWLLQSTRQRFQLLKRPTPVADTTQAKPAAPAEPSWSNASVVRMQNYRLYGTRALHLQKFEGAPAAPIHLLFGRNGTGKSSLVEAVELALTGKLEFFDEVSKTHSYASVLRNSDAGATAPCEIVLEAAGEQLMVSVADKPSRRTGNGKPVPAEIAAAACRLDQRLMDRLVTTERKAERTAILLKLAFPADRDLITRYEAAQRGTISARLPIAQELTIARDVLTRVGSWAPAPAADVERKSRAELANEWLHARALLEIARRDEQLTSVLHPLRGSWRDVRPPAIQVWLESERPRLPEEAALRDLEQSMHLLRARLSKPAAQAQIAARVEQELSAEELAALDAIGPWIVSGQTRGLGEALSTAFEHEQAEHFEDIEIGRDGWAALLQARIQTLETAANALRSQKLESSTLRILGFPVIPKEQEHHFQQLLQERNNTLAALQLQTEVDQKLVVRIRALGEPLNELVSLLTPARWAYGDILTQLEALTAERRPGVDTSPAGARGTNRVGVTLGVASGDQPLELRLNTAELNILALAIFLLSAPRTEENVFKLLVLDDPLQNMDELTVSCVARGLARLQRIWPSDWRALLTVHGEVNFKCLEQELFGAGYELPWLSPGLSQQPPVLPRPLAIAWDAAAQTWQNVISQAAPE